MTNCTNLNKKMHEENVNTGLPKSIHKIILADKIMNKMEQGNPDILIISQIIHVHHISM